MGASSTPLVLRAPLKVASCAWPANHWIARCWSEQGRSCNPGKAKPGPSAARMGFRASRSCKGSPGRRVPGRCAHRRP